MRYIFFSLSNQEVQEIKDSRNKRGVSTLSRSVSGEKENSSGNLKILPEIGRLKKSSGKHEVMKLKFQEFLPNNWDGIPNFR